MSGLVVREDEGGITLLTLNRPDKLNALSPALLVELGGHVDAIAVDQAVRCVVLQGAGRSFCAGADIEALKAGVVTDDPDIRSKIVERLGALPQAVIAAVHGHCYTGGLELALGADIIVAGPDARFCDTHAKFGIVPRWGMSARLPLRVGLAAAKRLSFTAAPVDAAEALRIGLCDHVAEAPATFAIGLARAIVQNAPASIAAMKHLYEVGLTRPLADALAYERRYTSGVYTHLRD